MHMLIVLSFLAASDDPPLAIRGATVVVEPGKSIENGTVVVRNGLIEAVGVDIPIPADAETLDGKGLIVYPGFIDAHSKYGLPDTKQSREQLEARQGERPDFTRDPLLGMQDANRKGLRPELHAADLCVPSESETKKWHSAGFATVLVAVDDEYLSGTSTVLSLNGRSRRGALLLPGWAMHASFRTYGEGYPRTLMGTIAHLKQFVLDAATYRRSWEEYRSVPRGKTRPPVDPALDALWPLLENRQPLVFEANSENDIHRALTLADECGLHIIIAGGAEADKLTKRLANIPVLLSLRFPEEPKKRKNDDRPKKLIDEETRQWEERIRCAIKLEEARVRVAFTTFGLAPGDALDNIQKLVERGLSRDAALAALTRTPAEILGLTELGTIEPGKIASLTVLTAPLGEKKTKVRYLIADGRKFEFDVKKAGGAPPDVNLSGTWDLRVELPKIEATMELKQTDAELSGKIVTDHGESEVTGSVSGRKFTLTGMFHGSEFTMEGEMKDEKLSGTVKTETGESGFSAAKPEGRDD